MRARRRIRRWVIFLVLVLLAGGAAVHTMVYRIPSEYQWRHFGPEKQKRAANAFLNHITADFGDKIGKTRTGETFTWTITADQANAYLASLDAIASLRSLEEGKPVHALAEMERAGLADPFVAMGGGVLTVMAKVRRYHMIFSVDLAAEVGAAGRLRVRIAGMRIGVMPVPRRLLEGRLRRVREALAAQLARAEGNGDARAGPADLQRVAKVMRQVLRMLNREPVRPVLRYKLGAEHHALVRRVEIADGSLTLHCLAVEE